jgi:hypothetical protein
MSTIDTYEFQLSQVAAALQADPENEGLLDLKSKLEELIKVTQKVESKVIAKEPPPESFQKAEEKPHLRAEEDSKQRADGLSNIEKAKSFSIGDLIQARWSEDNKFYDARIEAIQPNGLCTVTFIEYGSTEMVKPDAIRQKLDDDESTKKDHAKKRKAQAQGPERKKKKATFEERIAKKEAEQAAKQSSWQQFQAKGKKGTSASTSSAFKSRASSSVKPTTVSQFQATSKHLYK